MFIQIEGISNDKLLRNGKARVVRLESIAQGRTLDQERASSDWLWLKVLEPVDELDDSTTGINDIFDDQDVLGQNDWMLKSFDLFVGNRA